jgi:hypothetical protein
MRLSVEDSGPGIDPSMRLAVFERFSQADEVATRSHGGTGLDLAPRIARIGERGACDALTLRAQVPIAMQPCESVRKWRQSSSDHASHVHMTLRV